MLKSKCFQSSRELLLGVGIVVATTLPATADDLDVFNATLGSLNKPNILFVLDYSGSMNYAIDGSDLAETGPNSVSKADILKAAVKDLLVSNEDSINAGIGSLYATESSGVRWPISPLSDDAHIYDQSIPIGTQKVSDILASQLERTRVNGLTSTVNALAEAAAYFRGDAVLRENFPATDVLQYQPDSWMGNEYGGGNVLAAMPPTYTPSNAYEFNVGDSSGSYSWCRNFDGGDNECSGFVTFDCEHFDALTDDPDPDDDERAQTICKYNHPDKYTVANYVSPVTQSCQSNFIVLISDGSPSIQNDNATLTNILNHAGVSNGDRSKCEDLNGVIFSEDERSGNCGPEIVEYLANNDLNQDIASSRVQTYSVGFAVEGSGQEYLKLLAEKGNGEFFEASAPAELTAALNAIIDNILAGSKNFSEIALTIDPNTFSHGNRTYLSLFSPSAEPAWQGNLKGYFLDDRGLVDIHGNAATTTQENGSLQFADTAQSFWSSVPDGNEVSIGGGSESITELPAGPNARNMYTYLGGVGTSLSLDAEAFLEVSNSAISDDLLGNPGEGLRESSLNWLANAPMGDPLHSKPVVVNYENRTVVYTMTNQGFLHAFDATNPVSVLGGTADLSGGEELFAFMPKELLSNIPKLYQSTPGGDHIYGLDGLITRWHDDINRDNIVNDEDTVTLVFGMRRGGSSYYALDVTNPTSPKFKWQISNNEPDFERLAQSWSRASLISVNNNGIKERMLMFGGGYDANKVDGTTVPTEALGNAIFLVDADGQLVWSLDDTDHPDMVYSIPADLSIMDTDRNGMTDRVYFGDLGGQIWRVDFDNVGIENDVKLTKFADVNGLEHQPLFYAPSLSMNRYNGERFLAVAFGSGDRTQPLLERTRNALYMLRDTQIETGPPDSTFTTIAAGDIYNATTNDLSSLDPVISDAAEAELSAARGWSVVLRAGEKSLSKPITFEGMILATTFQPNPVTSDTGEIDSCSYDTTSRLYVMNLVDARPIKFSASGEAKIIDGPRKRFSRLEENMTIPTSPIIYFPSDSSEAQIIVGKESFATINQRIETIFWHAK